MIIKVLGHILKSLVEDLDQAKGIILKYSRKFAARGMKGHKARSGGGVHVRF